MEEVACKELLTSVNDLLTSGAYSDLKITCGPDTHNVHKAIVCTRAEFFARAIRFPGKESAQSIVDLPKDNPAVVKLLVQYLYEGDYDPVFLEGERVGNPSWEWDEEKQDYGWTDSGFPHTCKKFHQWDVDAQYCIERLCRHHTCGDSCLQTCKRFVCHTCAGTKVVTGPPSQLLVHSEMYEIADKYDVVALKDLAQEKFTRSCAEFWDSKEFAVAANHVFSSTSALDKGLRDVVAIELSSHMQLLQKPDIEALMTQYSSLAYGLLKAKSMAHGWQ